MRLLSRATTLLMLVALLLVGSSPAWAQTPAGLQMGTISAANACVISADLSTSPSAVVQLSGTWVGTLTFSASVDGNVYTTTTVVRQSTSGLVSTSTTNDTFLIANPGYRFLRACATSWTSGTAFVAVRGGYGAPSPQTMNLIATGQSTNLIAGASGTAGTVQIFPTTASQGSLTITATDQTGDTVVNVNAAAMGQATVLTIPDPGATTASFVLTKGAQTLAGVKTFTSIPVFPTTGITLNATTITEAEIGVLDGVTPGTGAASKAVTLDASADITGGVRNITTTGTVAFGGATARVGAAATYDGIIIQPVVKGAGQFDLTITTSDLTAAHSVTFPNGDVAAADFTKLTSLTATAAELNVAANAASSSSTITLGAGGGTTQTATFQMKDADGNAIAAVHHIRVYMATDAAGATPSAAGCNGAATVSVGAEVKIHTAKLVWDLVTDANGSVVITFNNAGGGGAYTDRVVLVLPNGQVVVSAALNVATA